MTEVGKKFDIGKPRWSLFPFRAAEEIVKVLTFGAEKYEVDNWKRVPEPKDRYFSAMLRHLSAWNEGERDDEESGLHHLGHAGCCLLFLIWFDLEGEASSD